MNMGISTEGLAPLLTAVAAIASTVAAAVMFYAQKYPRQKEQVYDIVSGPDDTLEAQCRLHEAKSELLRQEGLATWQGRAARTLTFSQYIIGGGLATSFIQETLSPRLVGLMGLLVLVSSLLHQHFRPDLQQRAAKERAVSIRRLIRQAEDDLFAITMGKLDSTAIHGIRSKITNGLAEIEESELRDLSKADGSESA